MSPTAAKAHTNVTTEDERKSWCGGVKLSQFLVNHMERLPGSLGGDSSLTVRTWFNLSREKHNFLEHDCDL